MTIAEFCDLWGTEGFRDLRRAILVDGGIVEMPPPCPLYDIGQTTTDNFLREVFPRPGHHVRIQQGFIAGPNTILDPDLAVVVGVPRDYLSGYPRAAILLVEIANTAAVVSDYCGFIAQIYAAAGVPEYWVLDVVGRQLLVFRDAVADPAAERAHRYATQSTLSETERVSPLATPAASVLVRDLLL